MGNYPMVDWDLYSLWVTGSSVPEAVEAVRTKVSQVIHPAILNNITSCGHCWCEGSEDLQLFQIIEKHVLFVLLSLVAAEIKSIIHMPSLY